MYAFCESVTLFKEPEGSENVVQARETYNATNAHRMHKQLHI